MNTVNRSFLTRDAARSVRSVVNGKAPAKLKAPEKDTDGLWMFPGLSHGSKLKTPAGILARIQRG